MKWAIQVDECTLKYAYVCKYAPPQPSTPNRYVMCENYIGSQELKLSATLQCSLGETSWVRRTLSCKMWEKMPWKLFLPTATAHSESLAEEGL